MDWQVAKPCSRREGTSGLRDGTVHSQRRTLCLICDLIQCVIEGQFHFSGRDFQFISRAILLDSTQMQFKPHWKTIQPLTTAIPWTDERVSILADFLIECLKSRLCAYEFFPTCHEIMPNPILVIFTPFTATIAFLQIVVTRRFWLSWIWLG